MRLSQDITVIVIGDTKSNGLYNELKQLRRHTFRFNEDSILNSVVSRKTIIVNGMNPSEAWIVNPAVMEVEVYNG
jgi:hypothetical protein